ncbi:MAG TPA: sigma-54 dependent transcriptional regulator [Syntrophales bacterium]|nr:sigma-54 dependent transcriptional regulator [Syntrophales bacterium]
MGNRIIVVDDEQDFLDSIMRGLITAGYKNVRTESNPKEAAVIFEQGGAYDIALIDITMPGLNGMELLEVIKKYSPSTECIMVTAVNEAKVAVECLKKGAYDYLVKPLSKDDLILRINHAEERKRLLDILDLKKKDVLPELMYPEAFENIVTRSVNVLRILKEAELHSVSDVAVLITGESGTGKELLAKAIHMASSRANSTFMPVNMASLHSSLFDAEFFGHTKGAFTGAEKDRVGYLEHANHGTLFLDEIGSMPFDLQGKLLRVLQEGEFTKLGTSRLQKTDVRFIAATNENPDRLLARGMFRKDLYYRLKGAWLHLPPLRERQEDIPLLIGKFLTEFQKAPEPKRIDEKAISMLTAYDYPGNIRELRSILQAAVNLAQDGPITAHLLPDHVRSRRSIAKSAPQTESEKIAPLAEVEKAHILKAYDQTAKNKTEAARLLNIGVNTLRRKLESYGVE